MPPSFFFSLEEEIFFSMQEYPSGVLFLFSYSVRFLLFPETYLTHHSFAILAISLLLFFPFFPLGVIRAFFFPSPK